MPMVKYKKRPFTYTTYSRGRKRTRHVGLGPFITSSSSSSADSRSATTSTNNADISELSKTDGDSLQEVDHNHASAINTGPTTDTNTEKSHTINGSNNCTQYSLQKTKRLEDWKNIRSNVFSCFLDGEYPKSATCSECLTVVEEDLLFRCVDCVQWDSLCIDCLKTRHQHPHLHLFEAWKNETYIGYTTETPHWKISSHNNCETSYMKDMVIVDGKGRQHNRMVEFCSCECEAVRLVKYKLWPSTSKFPKLAFHFDLLDWLNGLLLESHVSVKAFCESFKARSSKHSRSYVNLKIKDIYKVLTTETLEEYRHFIYKREHPFHDD